MREFAAFLQQHHLDDLARENLKRLLEHDIPLMRLFTELTEAELLRMTRAGMERFLGDILKNGKHLLALINDVLDLSKIEAGKAMGGLMWVESEMGQGSTFHFTVTLPPDEAVEGVPQGPGEASPRAGERLSHILLAEDSEDNRLVFEAFFCGSPYQVDFVENGQRAVERFLASSYDLILMDLQMVVMDGYAAMREIRRMEGLQRRATTPIIALTASVMQPEQLAAGDFGFNGHLAKPIRKDALLQAVRSFLQKQP